MDYLRTHSRPRTRGFTLVELMISLGIALMLIYGVNLTFRAVTDTIKTGNALSVATRKMRAVDSALTLDFEGTYTEINPSTPTPTRRNEPVMERRWSGIAPVIANVDPAVPTSYEIEPRQPAITIFCKRQVAFLNQTDRDADPDAATPNGAATVDTDDDGVVEDYSNPLLAAVLNRRVHRVDTIGFFAGGSFAPRRPQGGVAGSTSAAADQAWIWYGHALQHGTGELALTNVSDLRPHNGTTGKFYQPGTFLSAEGGGADNTRNYFASEWVLGRMAVTLAKRANSTPEFPGVPSIGSPSVQGIMQFFGETVASPTAIDFNAINSRVAYNATDPSKSSRFDTGAATPDSVPVDPAVIGPPFTSALNDVVGIWPGLAGAEALLPTGSLGTGATPTGPYVKANFTGLLRRYSNFQAATPDWWQRSMLQSASPLIPMRFNTVASFSKPVADGVGQFLTKNDKAAMQATYLAKGCTQFIVEFAGDFLTQDPATGAVAGPLPDGVLDFDIAGGVRQTQWYGLPRDIDGDGQAGTVAPPVYVGANNSANGDVVPVFVKAKQTPPPASASLPPTSIPFEKVFKAGSEYVVAFGPNEMYPDGGSPLNSAPPFAVRPWLIRLTATMVDPSGSLPNGFTRDFVFKVR